MSNAPAVYAAINNVKRELASKGGITKEKVSEAGGNYRFRGIDDMYDVLCGLTAKHGLVLFPRVVGVPKVEFTPRLDKKTGAQIGVQTHVYIQMEIDAVSEADGSKHTYATIGEGVDTSDKAGNKAMSAAHKYAHIMLFQIPTHGEMVDSEQDNIPVQQPQQNRSAPVAQQPPAAAAVQIVRSGLDGDEIREVPVQPAAAPASTPATRAPRKPRGQPANEASPPLPPPVDPIPELPAGGHQVNESIAEKMMSQIGDINTFPILHAFAHDANNAPEPARQELFNAVKSRAVFLFAQAQSMKEVQEGFPLVTALGGPDELKRAANQAYGRFRAPAQGGSVQ